MLNSRDISRLRDDVEVNCRRWVERCKAAGLNVLVTQTVRDKEYQEYLYAQGRTRPGSIVTNSKTPTFHADTAGLAFDFCKNIKGHEYDDTEFFKKAAAIAKEMGFSWGGDWKSFVDMPHIQWDNGGEWTSKMILAGRLPPAMPLWGEIKEDDDMNVDRFKELFREMRKELQDNEGGTYSAEAREWAVNNGLVAGGSSEEFNGMWEDFLTREQFVTVLFRFAQMMGMA